MQIDCSLASRRGADTLEAIAEPFLELTGENALQTLFMALALSTARMGALMYVFPLFTRTGLQQGLLRGGMALGLSLPVIPLVALELARSGPPELYELIGLATKEALIGICLGLVAGLPFWGAAAAGHIIDMQRGASSASLIDPNAGDDTTPFGVFLFYIFAAIFLSMGLLERSVLDPLYGSFAIWPPMSSFPVLDPVHASLVLSILGKMFAAGLALAAPLVLAMLTIDIGLAIASRFVPQINAFFLSMSFKTLLVIVVMPLYFATLVEYLRDDAGDTVAVLDRLREFLQ